MKTLKYVFATIVLALTLFSQMVTPRTVTAAQNPQDSEPWCGNMGESQNYGFTMDKTQYHWTVNAESFLSETAMTEADKVLDVLRSDNIADTRILFLNSKEIAVGPSCAGQFGEYMLLGNNDGPRADNGLVILFKVDVSDGKIVGVETNYAKGASLNALIADFMKGINRNAKNVFAEAIALNPNDLRNVYIAAFPTSTQAEQNRDASYLALDLAYFDAVTAMNEYARSKYEPYYPPTNTEETATPENAVVNLVAFCFVFFLIVIALMILAWLLQKLGIDISAPAGQGNTTRRNNDSSDDTSRRDPPGRGSNGTGKMGNVG